MQNQNPFDDDASAKSVTSASGVVAGALETVCRPFAPTLGDELVVEVGDLVSVIQAFDDGWARVRKQSDGSKGLIPIDCFRQNGEELPAFLASKRVSSFYGGKAV